MGAWSGPGWSLRRGDALEFVRSLEPASVAAFVMDPPYASGGFTEAQKRSSAGQGVSSERRNIEAYFEGDNMTTGGMLFLLRSVAFAAADALVEGGSLLTFCDWRQVAVLAPAIESVGLRWSNMVVWDKGSAALGTGFRAQHEIVLHFTRGKQVQHDTSAANVMTELRVPGASKEHFAQKPVGLLRRLVRAVSPEGGLVVDPFAGSGSTGVAAIAERRTFAGSERSGKFCEVAAGRMREATGAPRDARQAMLL